MMRARITAAFAAALMLTLAACSDGASEQDAAPAEQNVAELIAQSGDLAALSGLLEESGLAETFAGEAAYTVFAPSDDALAALGEEFAGEAARPALIAVLRDHVVPGYLTSADIRAAIAAKGGPVEMQTMGSGTLTFAMDGEEVTVAATGAANAVPVEGELLGVNGVVVPLATVLKDVATGG